MITKLPNGKFAVYSEQQNPKTGERRKLGTHDTYEHALQQLGAIEASKRRAKEKGCCG